MELISAQNNRRCNDSSTSFSFSQSFNIACTLQYTFLRVIDVRCHTDVKCSLNLVSSKKNTRMKVVILYLLIALPCFVRSTSFKMDFLSSGTVRTDPLEYSKTGNCLSDHVHRFYGAVSTKTMRPEVTFQDLRYIRT